MSTKYVIIRIKSGQNSSYFSKWGEIVARIAECKSGRVLEIYARLVRGETLNKQVLAKQYQVSPRSIQRDIESLRCFLADQMLMQDILHDSQANGYRLIDTTPKGLSNSEILAVCKILLDSRSLRKDEMIPILDKLVECCVPASNRRAVNSLLLNEKFHYIEPHHNKPVLDLLWQLGQVIQSQEVIEIFYQKLGTVEPVQRSLEPVGIMFSEYYFYVVGFLRNINKQEAFENPEDLYPTIYRVDRIQTLQRTGEHFTIPYKSRFEEGEFRKRVQFMYGGKLQTIRFKYTGPSIEAVLDRLPTAEIKRQTKDGWVVEAEVFGKGIEMWLKSQGDYIERIN